MQDSPIAMLQAANLYVYTVNNPIRWNDPTGLHVCCGGSGWSHANAPRPIGPRPPIIITREENNISITAHINIFGSGSDRTLNNIYFREMVIDGIINYWGGYRGGLNVDVTIIELNESTQMLRGQGQQFLSIEIRTGSSGSNRAAIIDRAQSEWSTTNVGEIVIWTGGIGLLQRELAGYCRMADFMLIVAHEFGHAMGIGDSFTHEYRSLMNSNLAYVNPQGATRLDVELALRASSTGTCQRWSQNSGLTNQFGIRRIP